MIKESMTKEKRPHYFLLLFLGVSIVLMFFIIKPFLTTLILAAVFAYLFQPIYQKLLNLTNNRSAISALIVEIMAVMIVLLPLTILGTLIFRESSGLYQSLTEGSGGFILMIQNNVSKISDIVPLYKNLNLDLNSYAQQGLGYLASNLGTIFSSFAQIILNIFVFILAFYFLLKDGKRLKNNFVSLSPLTDNDDEFIVSRLGEAVSATVKGNLLIGLIQGILTGIGFSIFDVPNATLWGGVAAVTTLIPGIGTALIITPAIIFLFFSGNTLAGVGLLAWGMTAVGLVDNFLGPRLVGRGMKIHSLIIFLSVLGGLAFFGPLGFLLGPLSASVCFALIDIYTALKNKENSTK